MENTGKWTTKSNPQSQIRWSQLIIDGEEVIAETNSSYARLIASAPDLLEACKMLLIEGPEYGFDGINVNCLEMARQAIAKATLDK